jgi:hypothetical protein
LSDITPRIAKGCWSDEGTWMEPRMSSLWPQGTLVICPSGCLLKGLSSLISDFPKNISVPNHPKSNLQLSHPTPPEGRIAIVTDARCGCGGRGSVLRAMGLQGGLAKGL